jgi:hypothetical protein
LNEICPPGSSLPIVFNEEMDLGVVMIPKNIKNVLESLGNK